MWRRHPSRAALLALVEQDGRARDRDHVDRCERCRHAVEDLRATLAAVRAVDVPEPSPLFWDHLSARVSAAIADEQWARVDAPVARGAAWRWILWLAGTTAAVVLAVLITWRPSGRPPAVPAGPVEPAQAAGAAALVSHDAEWEFLLDLAGMAETATSGELTEGVQPGMADRALLALSDSERSALLELLETELRQPSS